MEAPFGAKVPKKGRKVNDMKRLKKALALALALTVVMAFSGLSVFAADMSTYNSTVTVNGITQGNTLKLYKLADAVIGDDNVITYNFVSDIPSDYNTVDKITTAASTDDGLKTMANKIGAAFGGKNATYEATANDSKVATKEGVAPGWYFAIVSGTSDTGVVYKPMLINTTPKANNGAWQATNRTVDVKSEEEKITKTVGTVANAKTTDGYSVGQNVPFTLTTTIPNYPADSTKAKFVIGDKPNGVTINSDSVKVSVDGNEVATPTAQQFTIDVTNNVLTITFVKDYILTNAGKAVVVNYTAKLVGTPKTDGETAENTATIEYNPNPYEDSSVKPSDKTKVYTYGYVFDKVDNEAKALEGAVFTLYSDAECKNVVTDADGNTVTSTSTKVGDKAYVYFSGLGAGTYYAKETSAPAGFKTLTNPIEFTLSSTNATADNPATTDVTETNYLVNTTSVVNTPGSSLPETGGIGTTIFYIVGAILVVGAGILLISRRRMAAK